jgi:hypothetical protein
VRLQSADGRHRKKRLRVAALIRQGLLCRHCSDKECKDKGTSHEPIEIECTTCNGGGCDQCDQGIFRVEGCPNRFCDGLGQFVELVDLFDEGLPPVAGGALDQAASFLEAARRFKNEEQRAKAERA